MITPRHKILAFYGVPVTSSPAASVNYLRMTKFTQFTQNKNPQEYNRQYVDEPFQRTDVVGFAPQFDYAFDRHSSDNVHKDIMDMALEEQELAKEKKASAKMRAYCRMYRKLFLDIFGDAALPLFENVRDNVSYYESLYTQFLDFVQAQTAAAVQKRAQMLGKYTPNRIVKHE